MIAISITQLFQTVTPEIADAPVLKLKLLAEKYVRKTNCFLIKKQRLLNFLLPKVKQNENLRPFYEKLKENFSASESKEILISLDKTEDAIGIIDQVGEC
jgi:hypothetical protein